MKLQLHLLVACTAGALAGAAYGQNTQDVIQRDVDQQQRIEKGLQSGELTTKEAGKLEKDEAHIEKMESNAARDGRMTNAERQRIERAENKASADIYRDKHNGKVGDPNSASSQRMQADVQRNLNQQERIEKGVQNGSLSHHEVSSLERDQAHVDRKEARDAANGRINAREQRQIQAAENRQSRHIHRDKHNDRVR